MGRARAQCSERGHVVVRARRESDFAYGHRGTPVNVRAGGAEGTGVRLPDDWSRDVEPLQYAE